MDNELKGEGNSVNYRYRMHDPRVGRFFAVDPLFRNYSYNSPYAFSENKVIHMVELEGLEAEQTEDKKAAEPNGESDANRRLGNPFKQNNGLLNLTKKDKEFKLSLSMGGPIPFIAPVSNYGFAIYNSLINDSPNDIDNYESFDYIYNPGWKMDEPSSAFNVLELGILAKNGNTHNIGLGGYHYKFKTNNEIFHYGGGINQFGGNYLFTLQIGNSSFGFEGGGGLGVLATIPKFHGTVENYSMVTNSSNVFDEYKYAGYSISAVTGMNITVLKSDRIKTELFLRVQFHYFNLIDFEYKNDVSGNHETMYGFQNLGTGLIFGGKTSIDFNLRK